MRDGWITAKLEQTVVTEHLSLLMASITNTERSKFFMVASFNIPPYSPCSLLWGHHGLLLRWQIHSTFRTLALVPSVGHFLLPDFYTSGDCLYSRSPLFPPPRRTFLTTFLAVVSTSPSQLAYLFFEDFFPSLKSFLIHVYMCVHTCWSS